MLHGRYSPGEILDHRDINDIIDGDILNEASSDLNDGFHDILGDIDVTGDGIKMVNFGLLQETTISIC